MDDITLPKLTPNETARLIELRRKFPRQFMTDQTFFLTNEMRSYILDKKIWRMSIMGEVRMGKSEIGTSFALLYLKMFNELYDEDYFNIKELTKSTKLIDARLTFDIKHIRSSQEDYITSLRKIYSDSKLKFGQIFQIDENKQSGGGLGSYSTEADLNNLNNIVAKYMISEIWITPDRFIDRNCPYGLRVFKKDLEHKVNWCLLYKIEMMENFMKKYIFMGWVHVPLHSNEKLREEYNKKKNEWISVELEGGSDVRTLLRKEASKLLSKNELFARLTPSGKDFAISQAEQMSILEDYILDGKIQNFNEAEKFRVVAEARLIIKKQKWDQEKINEQLKKNEQ